MEKQKFLKLSYGGDSHTDTLEGMGEFIKTLDDDAVGEQYALEVVEMTQDEFDALPEFDGF